eukprot:TRINITY_DN2995_c0_g1_i1.p1 TRINITY_DN2995_c0_g1~~TRINITY_DN2995_c0_g1_i1.p1  ORF type:complete len:1171 (-),score=353.24 TRINITY_DN2995_c0_g1_i1:106-3522(-)
MHGSGKTTLCNSIINSYNNGNIWKGEYDIVFPVGNEYIDSEETDIIKYVEKKYNSSEIDNSLEMNFQEISKEKVLFTIDDFDKLNHEKAQDIIEKINNKEIENLLIFTSTLIPQISSLHKRLKLIGLRNIQKFIFNYFKDLSYLSQKLYKFLSQYPDISVLATNPLYLSQMCKMLETNEEMTMGEMYKKILKIIFGDPAKFELNKYSRRLLKEISSKMYKNGKTNNILANEIEEIVQHWKVKFSAEQIAQHLVNLGVLELKGQNYSFVHEDVLDYYYSYEVFNSLETLSKEKHSFSNVDLFLCHRLRGDPKKLFEVFNSLFKKQFTKEIFERKNEVCLFLNEIRHKENKEELQQIIKNLEHFGCQILIDACRDSNYRLFNLFDLKQDESVIDHCLKVSTYSDKRIVRKLLELKKSFAIKRSDRSMLKKISSMIARIKDKLGIDIHSLFGSTSFEYEPVVSTDFMEERNEIKEFLIEEKNYTESYFSWEPYTSKFLDFESFNKNPTEKDIFGKSLIYYLTQKSSLEAIRYTYKTFKLGTVEEDSFYEACKHERLEIVKFFIGVIEDNNQQVDDIIHHSKILTFKNKEIISLLIEKIYKKSSQRMLELLLKAVKFCKRNLLLELIKKGASVSSFLKGEPIFFQLFRNKKMNYDILYTFEKLHLNFNLKNTVGQNCLHLACIKEDIKLINHLVSYGVLINEIDEEEFRPLDHIKSINNISKLMKLGFKPNKENNSFLLKKVVVCNPNLTESKKKEEQEDEMQKEELVDQKIIQKEELMDQKIVQKEVLVDQKIVQKEIGVVSSLLDCLNPSKYKHILKFFVDINVKESILKNLVEKALRHDDQFLNNKVVFEKLFTAKYKNIFLEMSIIEPKVFVHSFKEFYLKDDIQFFKEILQFDEIKVAKMINLLPENQKIYLEKIKEIIKEENKELEKSFQNFFDVIFEDYNLLKKDSPRKDKPTKSVIFIDSHGVSTKSKLINLWITKVIEKIKGTEIKNYITFEVVNAERWEKEKNKLVPWIIFISSEVNNRGYFTFGNKEKSLDAFCYELLPEQTQSLGCIYLCAIDFFKKYIPSSKKETKYFPPWVVEEIITNHTEMKISFSFFFDMLSTLIFEEHSIRESCKKLEYLSINTRISLTETYNFS